MAKNKSGAASTDPTADLSYTTDQAARDTRDDDENLPPELAPLPDSSGHPGAPVEFQAMANDPEGDPLTFSLVSGPAGATMTADGWFSWTPTWGQLGAHTVTIRVTDPGGLSDTRSCTVSIINNPPELPAIPDQDAHPGIPVNLIAMANDPDGDPVTFSLITAPAGAAITAQGSFTWTPTWSQLGSRTITVRVTDPGGLSDTRSFTVNVINNAPEVMQLPDQDAHPTIPIGFIAMANDPDGDPVTFSLVSGPAGASVTAGGTFNWTPTWSQLGAFTVTIRATDPGGMTDARSCTINVVNNAPELSPLADQEVEVGTPLTFWTMANDIDGDPLTFSLIGPPAGATITPGGTFNWTPVAGQEGAHTITIRVADPGGLADVRSCTVTVTPAP